MALGSIVAPRNQRSVPGRKLLRLDEGYQTVLKATFAQYFGDHRPQEQVGGDSEAFEAVYMTDFNIPGLRSCLVRRQDCQH